MLWIKRIGCDAVAECQPGEVCTRGRRAEIPLPLGMGRERQGLPLPLLRGSAEGEHEGLHARIEKLDLEPAISNGLQVAGSAVQSLVGHRAVALLVNVNP